MTVEKRSGIIEDLSRDKIHESICNANSAVKPEDRLTPKQIDRITDAAMAFCTTLTEPIKIDILEDLIEQRIFENGGYEVGKRYITYRYEKERVRMNKTLTEKITASNVQNQNANVDEFSFGGRIGETTSYIMREYAFNHLVSEMAKRNHFNNEIYIHDADSVGTGNHNCLSIPFDKLLAEGFKTRQADIRPASSINTAFQLVAVLFQIQSLQQFGGVSATHLDWTMVPYVRKSFWKHYKDGLDFVEHIKIEDFIKETGWDTSKSNWMNDISIIDKKYKGHKSTYDYAMTMTQRELDQAVEGMFHNLNTLQSRSGCQLPFSSINYGICTNFEGRMVIRSLIEGSINGVGKLHRTSIFPCQIFQLQKGVNRKPGDPNYDLFRLALKSTSLRLYPNYANVDWSGNAGMEKVMSDKQEILDSLPDEKRQKIIDAIEKDPTIADKLGISLIEE